MSRTSGIAATAVTVGAVFLLSSPSALAAAPARPLPGGPPAAPQQARQARAASTTPDTPWAGAPWADTPWADAPFGRLAGPVGSAQTDAGTAVSGDAVGHGQRIGSGLELPPVAAVRAEPAVERPATVTGTTTVAQVGRPPSTQRLATAVLLALGTALAVVFLNRRRPVSRG